MKRAGTRTISLFVWGALIGACSGGFVRMEEARLAVGATAPASEVAAPVDPAPTPAIPRSGYLYLHVTSNFPFAGADDQPGQISPLSTSESVEEATFVETPTNMRLLTVFLKVGSGDGAVEIPLLVYDRSNGYAYRGIGMTAAAGLPYRRRQPDSLVARGLPTSAAWVMFSKFTELAQSVASVAGCAWAQRRHRLDIRRPCRPRRPWTDDCPVDRHDDRPCIAPSETAGVHPTARGRGQRAAT